MAKVNERMTLYEAPEGYVYDYAEPKDGEHLYVKYLYLSRFDTIKNYKLVKIDDIEN